MAEKLYDTHSIQYSAQRDTTNTPIGTASFSFWSDVPRPSGIYATIEIGDERGAFAIDEATLSYQAAKQYAQTHGIKIKNATRGGKLNVFQRVDFDSLFPKK